MDPPDGNVCFLTSSVPGSRAEVEIGRHQESFHYSCLDTRSTHFLDLWLVIETEIVYGLAYT